MIPSPAVNVGKLPVLVTVKLPPEPEMLIPDPAARLLTPVLVIVEYNPAVVMSMPAPACRVPPPDPSSLILIIQKAAMYGGKLRPVPDTDPSGAEIEVVALAEIPVVAGLNPISLPGPEPRLAELAVALSVLSVSYTHLTLPTKRIV